MPATFPSIGSIISKRDSIRFLFVSYTNDPRILSTSTGTTGSLCILQTRVSESLIYTATLPPSSVGNPISIVLSCTIAVLPKFSTLKLLYFNLCPNIKLSLIFSYR